MKSLDKQMQAYAAYHHDWRNKLSHVFGVPLVIFSLFILLSWFRFAHSDLPLTAGTLFFVGTLIYYWRLDRTLALLQIPINGFILWLADLAAVMPFMQSAAIFLAAFVGGWVIQVVGHYFEGRRPALLDNGMQIFNAPLFLTVEAMFLLGLRPDLKRKLDAQPRAH